MKFSIGNISRLTGFSPSGIRFFEAAGVITPARGENQKYREYSLGDLQLLMICRQYRDCGFSLQDSVDLLRHSDLPQILDHIDTQRECVRRQLAEKQVLLDFLEEKHANLESFQREGPRCRVQRLPALLWKKLWQPGDLKEGFKPSLQNNSWFLHSPIMDSCMLLSEESFLHGEGDLQTNWGIAIEKRYADKIGFFPVEEYLLIPSTECVRLEIKLNENLEIPSQQLDLARSFIAENQLLVSGLPISRIFYTTVMNDVLNRYDQLWIPVKKIL